MELPLHSSSSFHFNLWRTINCLFSQHKCLQTFSYSPQCTRTNSIPREFAPSSNDPQHFLTGLKMHLNMSLLIDCSPKCGFKMKVDCRLFETHNRQDSILLKYQDSRSLVKMCQVSNFSWVFEIYRQCDSKVAR